MPSPSQPKRLKSLSFYLGRAYYGYIGLVERTLQLTRLDGHLRPGMAHILLVLFERDNCIIKEIAKRVELSPSTLTGMLNRMEEAGLIRRHSDSDDRRAIRIRLTSRGKSLKHRMTRAQAIVEATLQGDLTKQELDAVKTGLARVIAAIVSICVAIGLFLFVTRAKLGKALRAAADNPTAAIYMGIDVDRAHRIAFAIGTGVTAVAGGLVATYYPFQPYVGIEFVIIMYAGVVLGGIGSVGGAFLGGFIIGLVQQLSTIVLDIQLQNAAIFVMFLLVVMFRPHGLFGRAAERT